MGLLSLPCSHEDGCKLHYARRGRFIAFFHTSLSLQFVEQCDKSSATFDKIPRVLPLRVPRFEDDLFRE